MKKDYSSIESYYDKYGTWYENERNNTYYYSFINEIEVGVVEEFSVGKKTLEVGCGTGIILSEVVKFSEESWGIDLSSGMLEESKRKGLNVKKANAIELPFDDKTFDVVYSFKVLAHIPDVGNVIEDINRVLKDNGCIILEFYNPYSLKSLSNKLSGATKKVYIRYDSYRDIKKLLSPYFSIVGVRGARIVTPFSYLLKVPGFGRLLSKMEKGLSSSLLKYFAGYFIVIATKKHDASKNIQP